MTTVEPDMPPGAHLVGDGVRFVAHASGKKALAVQLYRTPDDPGERIPLRPAGEETYVADVPGLGHGALYRWDVDGTLLPDPYARYLPHGVHGPAMVWQSRYRWRNGPGVSRPLREQVIYELHVGTFTATGTFAAAIQKLPGLAELGITTVELMPISSFAGARGWGYDGVAHFAPFAGYGTPDDLRAFIDAAHGLGLAVLLDVVYNHFGPAGNYLTAFASDYLTRDFDTPWGDAPDYRRAIMRRYLLDNARYWLADFRFDGLRLDATHSIADPPDRPILGELADEVRKLEPKKLLIAEDERNDAALVTRVGLDAVWADDFHHQLRVTLTGESDGYYRAYRPGARDLARVIEGGWLYTGQTSPLTNKPRGTPADALRAEQLVYCIQNHDQIGNRAMGDRLSAAVPPEAYAAASTLLLFLPMTPLLFMGQEWGATSPFLYFTDHEEELGRAVSRGRREEFKHTKAFSDPELREKIPDPQAAETFLRSRLDWSERERPDHARTLALYQALLHLRRTDPVLSAGGRDRLAAEAAGERLLLVRRWNDAEDRILVVNLDREPVGDARLPAKTREARILFRSDGRAPDERALTPLTAIVYAARR